MRLAERAIECEREREALHPPHHVIAFCRLFCGTEVVRFPVDRMADSDIEFEDDLPDWSDDDDKPKCASAAKERRTEPPLLLTSSDDLLQAVASQLAEEPVAATTVGTRQQNVFLSNLSHLFSVLIPLVRLPSSAPLPDCEALADLCVSALWVQAVRCALPTSVRVHMEANMQQQQFDLQPSHFQRILCHLLGVGAADIPPPPQVPIWPPHHRQQQEAALVQWLSNYPQLVEHPRLRAWPEGGADALEAAVMRRLHAATDDATAIIAARACAIWRLAATCRSLRRVLLLRLVQLRTTAMRVVYTKLVPLSCAELAARLDTPPILTQKGLRHWLLSPAQPEREVRAAARYAELCARKLSHTDRRIISWALAAAVPSSAQPCTGRRWPPLLTKITIVGAHLPINDMSRAGFRNVGLEGKIYLLSQPVLADVEGTRAAWFWFGPEDISMDVPFHFRPLSLASYEFPTAMSQHRAASLIS